VQIGQPSRSLFKDDRWYQICRFDDPQQYAQTFEALFCGDIV
jgi:hypothetical protein